MTTVSLLRLRKKLRKNLIVQSPLTRYHLCMLFAVGALDLSVRRIDQAAEIGTSKHPNWDQLAVAVGRQQLATNERLYIAVIDMSLTQQHLGKLVKPSVREANRYRCYFMVDYAKMFFSVIWVITIKLSVAKTTVQLPMSVCLCVFNSMNKSRHDVH